MENLVLDKAFALLCAGVEDLIVKNFIFKSLLSDAKSRLDKLEPLIKTLAHYNQKMVGQDQKELEALKGVLKEGQELINECSTITRWSPFKKYMYARKILKWEDSLKSPLEGVKLQEAMNVMDMRVDIKSLMLNQKSGESSNSSTRLELPPLPDLIVGLDAPLKDLKEKLLCDDGKSMLVLTAPGGCGKTTLATTFCNDEEVKGKFKKNIIFITVSQTGNLELVVKRLCEHVGSAVPNFKNEVHMRQWMETFRKERPEPFLFVLDDIWFGSESILESFQAAMSNHKILVTSRSEFPRFSSKSYSYQLKLLNDDEAIKLFFYHTALGDERSSSKEELSRKIVKRCKGFPLAIKVVGSSLSGEPLEVWKERESEWSKGSSILDSETDLLVCLQSSLDALDRAFPMKKDCFLDLGCFSEDKKIPVGDLVDMWAELYDKDDDVVFAYVHKLCNRNLATLGDERFNFLRMDGDDYYGKRFVTQHDLLRELAIYNTMLDKGDQIKRLILEIRGNNKPKWWKEHKCQPTNARLVSITTDGQFSMEWPQIQLPEAEVLVLDFKEFRYALPEFVKKMDKLKVVVIGSRYSSFQLENLKLLQHLPNLKRMSLSNIPIENITKNPIQLKSLKKISLYSCHSEASFEKGDGTMSDAFPNLEELNIDCCDMPEEMLVGFCTLIHLKKLSIFSDVTLHRLPKEIGDLVNLEVLRIRDCTEVSEFSGSIRNLKKLKHLDLSGCFEIQLPEDIGELSSLRKLDMRSCYQVFHLPRSVAKLQQLVEVVCDELKNPLWEAIPTLTKLHKEPQNYGPGHSAALEKADELLKQFLPEWFHETWQK